MIKSRLSVHKSVKINTTFNEGNIVGWRCKDHISQYSEKESTMNIYITFNRLLQGHNNVIGDNLLIEFPVGNNPYPGWTKNTNINKIFV